MKTGKVQKGYWLFLTKEQNWNLNLMKKLNLKNYVFKLFFNCSLTDCSLHGNIISIFLQM